ncbi:hypothetical protein F5887DRAFT_98095 [Amanita rubescens]|nr:hypothetical protein F5887DRAFT_98095 [Amanita rubescens]
MKRNNQSAVLDSHPLDWSSFLPPCCSHAHCPSSCLPSQSPLIFRHGCTSRGLKVMPMSGTENNTLLVEHCATFLCFSYISQGVNENYRNDVMKIHKSGYIDFGDLNPEPGKQRIILSPPVYLNRQNQLRALGVWRRISKDTTSPEDRLIDLHIWEENGFIKTGIKHIPVRMPSSFSSFNSFRKAGPLPYLTRGTWYRVFTTRKKYRNDAIIIDPATPPKLYSLTKTGELRWASDSVQQKRFVGGWYRWPDPSNADGRDDLLLFWMVGGELRYKVDHDPSRAGV